MLGGLLLFMLCCQNIFFSIPCFSPHSLLFSDIRSRVPSPTAGPSGTWCWTEWSPLSACPARLLRFVVGLWWNDISAARCKSTWLLFFCTWCDLYWIMIWSDGPSRLPVRAYFSSAGNVLRRSVRPPSSQGRPRGWWVFCCVNIVCVRWCSAVYLLLLLVAGTNKDLSLICNFVTFQAAPPLPTMLVSCGRKTACDTLTSRTRPAGRTARPCWTRGRDAGCIPLQVSYLKYCWFIMWYLCSVVVYVWCALKVLFTCVTDMINLLICLQLQRMLRSLRLHLLLWSPPSRNLEFKSLVLTKGHS